jgi:hypothetical protein
MIWRCIAVGWRWGGGGQALTFKDCSSLSVFGQTRLSPDDVARSRPAGLSVLPAKILDRLWFSVKFS